MKLTAEMSLYPLQEDYKPVIQAYIERDRPDAAERLTEKLLRGIESLERYSLRGVLPRDERLRKLGYRVLIEGGAQVG